MAGCWEVILRWNPADVFAECDKEFDYIGKGPLSVFLI